MRPICSCQTGFYGQFCEFEDKCNGGLGLSNPCNKENSICVNVENGEAMCQCFPGFTGETCSDKIPGNKNCDNGYYGEYCDIDKYSWYCDSDMSAGGDTNVQRQKCNEDNTSYCDIGEEFEGPICTCSQRNATENDPTIAEFDEYCNPIEINDLYDIVEGSAIGTISEQYQNYGGSGALPGRAAGNQGQARSDKVVAPSMSGSLEEFMSFYGGQDTQYDDSYLMTPLSSYNDPFGYFDNY